MKTPALLLCLIPLSMTGRLLAEPTTTTPTETSAPPAAYTDQGGTANLPTYPLDSAYQGFGGDSSYYSSTRSLAVSRRSMPLYYPPVPPALGEADFKRRNRTSLARLAPSAALAEDLYEPYYAALSVVLYNEDLTKKRKEQLDAYHAGRTALLTELRSRLDALKTADPAARESGLAALAREQAPRLAALAKASEDLREGLTNGGFFESSIDWNQTRNWRLGDDTRWESQIDEIKVIRASAAFQEGLSPEQRRLLRELEMELNDSLRDPTAEISLLAPGPFCYFSPETARIRLPLDLPADLSAKIDAYKAEKAALKQELREVLYQKDRAFFSSTRTKALKELAQKQAPRFVRVEMLAEEIRRGLVPLPNPAKPPALPLPANLSNGIKDYNQKKAALQQALLGRQEEIRRALPYDRVEFTRTTDAYVVNIVPNRRSTPEMEAKRREIIASLVPFNEEQARLYKNLVREKETLGAQLTAAVQTLGATKSIDQLQREFAYALKKQEIWDLYRDYEIAVLEPGLSPEQRRILFGAGLENLDLPLAN